MLDIGFQELIVLMVIALLVFGPYKLPELGRALGRAMREFRRASDEFRATIETNLNITEDASPTPAASAAATTTASEPAAVPAAGADAGLASLDIPVPSEPVPFGASSFPVGASGVEPPPPVAPVEPFCAQRGGRLLHRSTCAWTGRIAEADRIVLKTAAEGVELALAPCPVCDPRDGETPA